MRHAEARRSGEHDTSAASRPEVKTAPIFSLCIAHGSALEPVRQNWWRLSTVCTLIGQGAPAWAVPVTLLSGRLQYYIHGFSVHIASHGERGWRPQGGRMVMHESAATGATAGRVSVSWLQRHAIHKAERCVEVRSCMGRGLMSSGASAKAHSSLHDPDSFTLKRRKVRTSVAAGGRGGGGLGGDGEVRGLGRGRGRALLPQRALLRGRRRLGEVDRLEASQKMMRCAAIRGESGQ